MTEDAVRAAGVPRLPNLQCSLQLWREGGHISHLLHLLHIWGQLRHAEPGHRRHH